MALMELIRTGKQQRRIKDDKVGNLSVVTGSGLRIVDLLKDINKVDLFHLF